MYFCLQELNLPVVGSQIVGLLPLKAVLDCAEFYIRKEKLFVLEEEHKVRLVSDPDQIVLYRQVFY